MGDILCEYITNRSCVASECWKCSGLRCKQNEEEKDGDVLVLSEEFSCNFPYQCDIKDMIDLPYTEQY